MSIAIKEVSTKKELKEFVKFPLRLYKDCPHYVPPLISSELKALDKTENPVFEHAEAHYFLAYKGNEIVGRVAAIYNFYDLEKLNRSKIRFSWFDVIDDVEVTKALLDKVIEIGKSYKAEYIEGPIGFSNLDKAGMLTEGFDRDSTMTTFYNYEYYKTHLEQLGFETSSEWVESYLTVPEELPEKVVKFSKIVEKRYKLKSIRFNSKKEMQSFVSPMFKLLEETYSVLESFVPFSDAERDYYAKKYLDVLLPEYVNCIVDENGDLCSFAITMPSLAEGFKKAKGKLFPFGWWHLLKAMKTAKVAEYILIGVHPKYQNKGVTAMIFCDIFETFRKYKLKNIETNPQLVENKKIQLLWEEYNPILHKRRKSFRKNIE